MENSIRNPKKYIEREVIELVVMKEDIDLLELLISKGIGSWDDVKIVLKIPTMSTPHIWLESI